MIEQWKKIQRGLMGIPEPGESPPGEPGVDRPMTEEEAMWAAWDRM